MADRVSALPDEILCHILSFLPTENAVATAVLSKRWTHLWRSVPVLDFSTNNDSTIQTDNNHFSFHQFVFSVLLLRDAQTPINKFQLKCIEATDLDLANINKWLNFVTQGRFGLQHLHLHLTNSSNMWPRWPTISIFTCRTLVVLKLCGFVVTDRRKFPITLPSLKILHFEDGVFKSVLLLKKFLVGCPILEEFHVRSIGFHMMIPSYAEELKNVILAKLTRAHIVDSDHPFFPLKPFSNVKSLCVEIDHQVDHDFPLFHNLTHLELLIHPDRSELLPKWLAKLPNQCPKLQSLVFQRLEESRDLENWEDPEFVPECLALNLKTCTFRDFEGFKVEFQLARYVLKNARVLETMTICNRRRISRRQMKKLYSAAHKSTSRCQIIVNEM